jgi:hypothetical protein
MAWKQVSVGVQMAKNDCVMYSYPTPVGAGVFSEFRFYGIPYVFLNSVYSV